MSRTHFPSRLPPRPKEEVLSTLNRDGSRKRLRPRPVKGRFYRRRRALAYALIGLFVAMPLVHVGGRPLMLLDLAHRRFTIFGATFLASDTMLLMLVLLAVVVSVFLLTALFGRVWCGWGCPQTVYMEFLFRPLERIIEGKAYGPKRRPASAARTVLKQAVFLVLSVALAHVFLAYFVGIGPLLGWITESPGRHLSAFVVMLVTTALIYFDFAYFREQTCIVACPYGRLQAVLLDRRSMIVGYDRSRGEPRGARKRSLSAGELAALGDCVNCGFCTRVCPMGIDIRDGLQLECITCTSCVDACDATMARVGLDPGLVRYTSQAEQQGDARGLLRPRVLVYPGILLVVAGLFTHTLLHKGSAEVTVLRGLGEPYTVLPGDEISNPVRVKVVNRARYARRFSVAFGAGGADLNMVAPQNPIPVPGEGSGTAVLFVIAPRRSFSGGERAVALRVRDGEGFDTTVTYRLLGPGIRERADSK